MSQRVVPLKLEEGGGDAWRAANAIPEGFPDADNLGQRGSMGSNSLPMVSAKDSRAHVSMQGAAIEFDGEVVEALPRGIFRVEVEDTEQVCLCTICGKIRKNNIKILVGDRVTVSVSPYDLS